MKNDSWHYESERLVIDRVGDKINYKIKKVKKIKTDVDIEKEQITIFQFLDSVR